MADPVRPTVPQKVKKAYTVQQKGWLLDFRDQHAGQTQAQLAAAFRAEFGGELLKRATLCDWLKSENVQKVRDRLNAPQGAAQKTSKRNREAKFPKLEAAVSLWFFDKEDKDATITDDVLREKATQLGNDFPLLGVAAGFKYSTGWVQGFKKRHNIKRSRF